MASAADFSELSQQIADVTFFLRQNMGDIKALVAFPAVTDSVLDFGTEIHRPGWDSFCVPPQLLLLVGEAGVSLGLSVYPIDGEAQADV